MLGLSILHLLDDRDDAIARVAAVLKPGGIFVSGTPCLADGMSWIRPFLAVGRSLGLVPLVKFFTARHLEASLIAQGLEIDHRGPQARGEALFLVARKRA